MLDDLAKPFKLSPCEVAFDFDALKDNTPYLRVGSEASFYSIEARLSQWVAT